MSLLRALLYILGALVLTISALMLWGSRLLVTNDSLPAHSDAAVVLQGSVIAEKARLDGAVDLLRRGLSDRALISLPRESYWGQPVAPAALGYIEKQYGPDVAAKMEFCETAPEVESTREEAQAVSACIRERHWRSVVIVTSDYHTRRAGFLWRRAMRQSETQVWIHGVVDPEFQSDWWRRRRSAKIFVLECSKLLWTVAAER